MRLSVPIGPCESTAPRGRLVASVVTLKVFINSGYCNKKLQKMVHFETHFCKVFPQSQDSKSFYVSLCENILYFHDFLSGLIWVKLVSSPYGLS